MENQHGCPLYMNMWCPVHSYRRDGDGRGTTPSLLLRLLRLRRLRRPRLGHTLTEPPPRASENTAEAKVQRLVHVAARVPLHLFVEDHPRQELHDRLVGFGVGQNLRQEGLERQESPGLAPVRPVSPAPSP